MAQQPRNNADFHTFVQYEDPRVHQRGIIVPQAVYTANGRFDDPLPVIRFAQNGVLGVKLSDALDRAPSGLTSATVQPSLSNAAKKITIRINVR